MAPKKDKPFSHQVGSFLAVIQSTVDDLFEMGFKKLKSIGKAKRPPKKDPDSLQSKATEAAHTSAEFLGEVGESFYDQYKKLKSKKSENKEK